MVRTLIIGAILVLAFALAFAPATLLNGLLPADGSMELLQAQGTVWNGSADLSVAGRPAGQVTWSLRPAAIVRATLGYDVSWRGPDHDLTGQLDVGFSATALRLAGDAAAAFANAWLAPYDISISGDLELREIAARLPYDFAASGAGTSSGTVTWNGGPIRYRLSGRAFSGRLPPLVAYLGDGLEAVVYPQDGETPLLRLQVSHDGFVRVGVTQLLTRLAGNPWPGSHADHDVVLEVEEQLF